MKTFMKTTTGALALMATTAMADTPNWTGSTYDGATNTAIVLANMDVETDGLVTKDGAMTVAVLDEMRPSSEAGDDMGVLTMATDLPLTIPGVIGQTPSWFTVAMTELPVPDGPQTRMMDLAALTDLGIILDKTTAFGAVTSS